MGAHRWTRSGEELALHLMQARRRHTVVVTHIARSVTPGFDAEAIHEEVKDWAEVIVVTTGRVTYQLRDHLPYGWEVYGSAARVYPIGVGTGGIAPGKPYVARRGTPLKRISDELIDEVLFLPDPRTLVVSAPPVPGPGQRNGDPVRILRAPAPLLPGTGSPSVLITGVVTGFREHGFTALVSLGNGGSAEIHSEDIYAAAPLDWILEAGSTLTGSYEPATGRLSLHESLLHPKLLAHYSWNQVVPALVIEAGTSTAVLVPVPGENITVHRQDVSSNELDDVDSLLAPGQVVAARLVNAAGVRKLVLVDVDDGEPVAVAPALVRGGIPWLVVDRDHVPEHQHPPGPATPAHGLPSVPVPEKQREALRQALLQIDALKSELRALGDRHHGGTEAELALALGQLTQYRAEANKLRTMLRSKSEALNQNHRMARKKARSTVALPAADFRDKFTTADQALLHELYLEWVQRIPANEKTTHPWRPDFIIGPKFAASFYSHDAPLRGKTLKALIQLLTGRAERSFAREVHPKRTGPGGDDPQVVRSGDGATCWRMSVEIGVAAARRVHYWKLPDGRVELHELVAHDTFDL